MSGSTMKKIDLSEFGVPGDKFFAEYRLHDETHWVVCNGCEKRFELIPQRYPYPPSNYFDKWCQQVEEFGQKHANCPWPRPRKVKRRIDLTELNGWLNDQAQAIVDSNTGNAYDSMAHKAIDSVDWVVPMLDDEKGFWPMLKREIVLRAAFLAGRLDWVDQ